MEVPCTYCHQNVVAIERPDWMANKAWEDIIQHAMCQSCGKTEKQKLAQQEQQRQADESFLSRLEESTLERFRMGFDPKHPKANHGLFDWVNCRYRHDSMFLCGNSGTGKTRVLQEHLFKLLRETTLTAYYSTATDLADLLTKESRSERSKCALIERLRRYDVLVIDDLGKESVTDARMASLFQIIDARYTAREVLRSGRKPYYGYRLWVSSQKGSKELMDDYGSIDGKAIIRRIVESSEIFSQKTEK